MAAVVGTVCPTLSTCAKLICFLVRSEFWNEDMAEKTMGRGQADQHGIGFVLLLRCIQTVIEGLTL